MKNALDSIRILDLSKKLTVSLATMYLSSYGAEVIKVEPPEGDPARKWNPKKDGVSVYFNYLNSGKKSIVLDIKTETGIKTLKRILPEFDVICHDMTEQDAKELGIDYESIKEICPDIIYGHYSYFGDGSPMSERKASSLVVQALGVAMDMTGMPGEEPVNLAPSVGEHYSAAYLATGIVMALIDKSSRGIGQKVDISLLDSLFSCIEAAPAAISSIGEIQRRKGNDDPTCAPYDSFKTNDGYVALGVATHQQWLNFCKAMSFEDFEKNPDYLDDAKRLKNYHVDLRPKLAARLEKMSKFEVESKARTLAVPCGAVLNVSEVISMPNTKENNYMTDFISEKLGVIQYPTIPFVLSETKPKDFEDAPELGTDTNDIIGREV